MTNTPMTFEEWHKSKNRGYSYKKTATGKYVEARVDLDYEIWQACEQQNQAVIADLTAKLEWWRELFPSITPKAAVEYQTVYDKADKAEALNAELVEALEKAREMIGHEDNIAFIDSAIAKVKGK